MLVFIGSSSFELFSPLNIWLVLLSVDWALFNYRIDKTELCYFDHIYLFAMFHFVHLKIEKGADFLMLKNAISNFLITWKVVDSWFYFYSVCSSAGDKLYFVRKTILWSKSGGKHSLFKTFNLQHFDCLSSF